jgi:predicted DNA-binding WGR domain protein
MLEEWDDRVSVYQNPEDGRYYDINYVDGDMVQNYGKMTYDGEDNIKI